MRAHLLLFPVSANLAFLQGPSAQSTQRYVCAHRLCIKFIAIHYIEKSPRILICCGRKDEYEQLDETVLGTGSAFQALGLSIGIRMNRYYM
jgi:hypothetical protein